MAQIDRLLSVVVAQRAEELQLAEQDVAKLAKGGTAHALTRQPLTAPQLVALLREIAPAEAQRQLDAGEATSFEYRSADGVFAVKASPDGGRWTATATTSSRQTPAPGDIAMLTPHAGSPAIQAAVRPSAAVPQPDDAAALATMEELLRLLVARDGSDLHLRCTEPPILRVHGELVRVEGRPALENAQLEAMLRSIMPNRNRDEFAATNDTDFAYEIEGLARFRANVLRDRRGVAAVFRFIPSKIVSAEDLGLAPEVQALCNLSKGLVLVTGPTGSGKSTTLCGLIDLVNRTRSDHVITIEDPIEFVHQSKRCVITQRQVGLHTGSFKHALRAALREDPDIVLVGELRDLETTAIAIETAETGHLVFATLHTTTAPSTIDRVIDQFPPDRQEQVRVMLSESLKGVISQTLCKKIGGGRVAAREVLLSTPAVSNLIREAKTFQLTSVMQTSRRQGMLTLNDALIELVDSGQVEPKEAYVKAVEKSGFVALLRARSHDVSFLETEQGASAAPPARAEAGIGSGVGVKTPMPRPGFGTKR